MAHIGIVTFRSPYNICVRDDILYLLVFFYHDGDFFLLFAGNDQRKYGYGLQNN